VASAARALERDVSEEEVESVAVVEVVAVDGDVDVGSEVGIVIQEDVVERMKEGRAWVLRAF